MALPKFSCNPSIDRTNIKAIIYHMHLPLFPALIFGLLQHINNLSLPETSAQMIPCKPGQDINLVTYIKLTVTVAYFVCQMYEGK